MPIDEDVRKSLLKIMDGFQMSNQEIAKLQASLDVLRTAIASTQPNPEAYEQQLRQQEKQAQSDALAGQQFPQLDATLTLAKAGKSADKPDS
jgi:hypothetical protein